MSNQNIIIPPNPAHVSQELLERYTTRGPRYTSYPTAPQFVESVDREELINRWQNGNNAKNRADLSLYAHIPFCRKRCRYCGCFTCVSNKAEAADPYLDQLITEMKLWADHVDPTRPVRQIALGGGTPTFLTPDRFDRLMQQMRSIWSVAEDAEISVEIDPRTATPEHVEVMLAHGFNRFSLGVQDFDADVQRIIGREQPREMVANLVELLRASEQHAINFDLIYGLPGQTRETMQESARRTIELSPSRIALFGYAHVPWMQSHQKVLESSTIPAADEKLALFGVAYDAFVEAGYVPVGMDHFAHPDDELVIALSESSLHRNFMGYTTRRGLDQVAFGVSGISSVSRTYSQNEKDLKAYADAIGESRLPVLRGYLLSDEDAMRRELIIDLFCNFHLDGNTFGNKWGIDFARHFETEIAAMNTLQADGIVEIDDNAIEVTPMGRAFIRNVCMVFDKYLEAEPALRRYSQTV